MRTFLLLLLSAVLTVLFAQSTPYADSVVAYNFGTNTNFGQDSAYFPANILGFPDTAASSSAPSSVPEEICALGMGGEIILAFTDNVIINGEGSDFTVFENPFIVQAGPRKGEVFAEPAKVAVSYDGINFYEFPFDTLTLEGCAGVTPVNGNEDPLNPELSGGDSFDIGLFGLDSVKFVKITDVTEIIKNDPEHPFFDFTANGFDLDAVVAVHSADPITSLEPDTQGFIRVPVISASVYPNPVSKSIHSNARVRINTPENSNVSVKVYNLIGEEVLSLKPAHITGSEYDISFFIGNLTSGIYILSVTGAKETSLTKFTVIK